MMLLMGVQEVATAVRAATLVAVAATVRIVERTATVQKVVATMVADGTALVEVMELEVAGPEAATAVTGLARATEGIVRVELATAMTLVVLAAAGTATGIILMLAGVEPTGSAALMGMAATSVVMGLVLARATVSMVLQSAMEAHKAMAVVLAAAKLVTGTAMAIAVRVAA